MDSNGNLFFGLMDPIAIACWDSSKPYTSSHMRVVAQNDETLQFSSGMKVVLNKKGKEELWVLTCSFQVRNGIFSFFYSNNGIQFDSKESNDWQYLFPRGEFSHTRNSNRRFAEWIAMYKKWRRNGIFICVSILLTAEIRTSNSFYIFNTNDDD